MSILEILFLGALVTHITALISVAISSRTAVLDVWSPMTAVAIFFAFYCVVGPLISLAFDETYYVARDFRPLMEISWIASYVALCAIHLGYRVCLARHRGRVARVSKPVQASRFEIRRMSYVLFLFGLCGGTIWIYGSGTLLSLPVLGISLGTDSNVGGYDASRVNYFYHAINAMVPALLLVYLSNERKSPEHGVIILVTALILLTTFLVYSSVGFRYRLLILLISLYAAYHLKNNRVPRIVPGILLLTGFLITMSVISIARAYYEGLDFTLVAGATFEQFVLGGTRDTNIFFALGAVLDAVPNRIDYAYFEPFLYVFVLPIPRIFWAGKPYPEYLGNISQAIGTFEAETAGSAIPNFGEFYMSFGWIGLVLGSIAFGYGIARVWIYFRPWLLVSNVHVASYCIFFPFVIYALSRGYLAQIFQDAFFFFVPLAVSALVLNRSRGVTEPNFPASSWQSQRRGSRETTR